MTNTLVSLLADADRRILSAYLGNQPDPGLDALFDAMGIEEPEVGGRISVAVAQVLLEADQDLLPQWSCTDDDGEVRFGRQAFARAEPPGRLRIAGELVCCINWADSGPGFSWPESYHLFRVPGFDRYVVTASRDSSDGMGCSDNAIGHRAADVPPLEAARELIVAWWRWQKETGEQARWAYLFYDGLADRAAAARWAGEVWHEEDETGEDEGDEVGEDRA